MRTWLLVAALGTTPVLAAPATGPARHVVHSVLQLPDSLRARMLAALGRGDVVGAVSLWELETGKNAPQWLLSFQAAFSPANQRAGPCIQVARDVFEGFKRLGARPTFIEFVARGPRRFDKIIAFELRAGKPSSTIQISENALHYAVQVEDRVYDAMTGPVGLSLAEYMKRLQTPGSLSMKTLSQLP
jgi:hypothetical protein